MHNEDQLLPNTSDVTNNKKTSSVKELDDELDGQQKINNFWRRQEVQDALTGLIVMVIKIGPILFLGFICAFIARLIYIGRDDVLISWAERVISFFVGGLVIPYLLNSKILTRKDLDS